MLTYVKDYQINTEIRGLVQEFGNEFRENGRAYFFFQFLSTIFNNKMITSYFSRLQTTKQRNGFANFFTETFIPRGCNLSSLS